MKLILVVFPILFICQFSISFAFDCDKVIYICDWKEKVSIVKTQNITASAVKLTDNFYVTNKHVVEDNYYANLYDNKGSFLKAKVLQNDHPADLIILSINHENNQAIIPYKITNDFNGLRSVAFGIGRQTIRIFPPGNLISLPSKKYKQARIHSTIKNLPGISGGALINKKGQLVGILTSGSGNYNEAIPVNILNEVIELTTKEKNNYDERYKNIRRCAQAIEIMNNNFNQFSQLDFLDVENNCNSANLKTFYDMLGQIYGNYGDFKKSLLFLKKSSKLDPNSPTSLISLAVAYQFNKDFQNQAKVLKRLINLIPQDVLVLRMAIQSSAFSNDIDFARKSLILMKKYNKRAFSQAYNFLKQSFPNLQNK
ncbi:MAG: trypsin-like peptidase domain-containing protein [Paracoccaceae bacterium]